MTRTSRVILASAAVVLLLGAAASSWSVLPRLLSKASYAPDARMTFALETGAEVGLRGGLPMTGENRLVIDLPSPTERPDPRPVRVAWRLGHEGTIRSGVAEVPVALETLDVFSGRAGSSFWAAIEVEDAGGFAGGTTTVKVGPTSRTRRSPHVRHVRLGRAVALTSLVAATVIASVTIVRMRRSRQDAEPKAT